MSAVVFFNSTIQNQIDQGTKVFEYRLDLGRNFAQTGSPYTDLATEDRDAVIPLIDFLSATTAIGKTVVMSGFNSESSLPSDAVNNPIPSLPYTVTRDSQRLQRNTAVAPFPEATLLLDGLNPAHSYTVKIYGHDASGTTVNRATDITIDGVTHTLDTADNHVPISGVRTVSWTNVKPSGDSKLLISFVNHDDGGPANSNDRFGISYVFIEEFA